jgi:hypothetical protein
MLLAVLRIVALVLMCVMPCSIAVAVHVFLNAAMAEQIQESSVIMVLQTVLHAMLILAAAHAIIVMLHAIFKHVKDQHALMSAANLLTLKDLYTLS